MIKKIILIMILFLWSGFVFAEPIKIADVSVHNFAVENNQEVFSFKVVNRSKTNDEKVNYGISLRDSQGNSIRKIAFPDIIEIPKARSIEKSFNYIIKDAGISSIALFINDQSGLPLSFSIIEVEPKKEIKSIGNIFQSCFLNKTEKGNIIQCEKSKNLESIKMSIFERTLFGKKIKTEIINWQSNSKERNNFIYTIPELNPGFYKIKLEKDNLEKVFDLTIPGKHANINRVIADQASYKKGDIATLKISSTTNKREIILTYGILDVLNETCTFDQKTSLGAVPKVEVKIQKECIGAKAFLIISDSDNKILAEYGTLGKSKNELQGDLKLASELSKIDWKIIIYIALGFFFISIMAWFFKKKTLSISIIIILVMLLLIIFGYSKVSAATYIGERNTYMATFSQASYTTNEFVKLNIGVFDTGTGNKHTDSSVYVSLNNQNFYKVIDAGDRIGIKIVDFGKLSVGLNKVVIRGVRKSEFDVSRFSNSRFDKDGEEGFNHSGFLRSTFGQVGAYEEFVVEILITLDADAPSMSLVGDSNITINKGSVYEDDGATASDAIDGDITRHIVVTGLPINTARIGTYLIRYNVTDSDGNRANEIRRIVNILDPDAGIIIDPITGDPTAFDPITGDPTTFDPRTGFHVPLIRSSAKLRCSTDLSGLWEDCDSRIFTLVGGHSPLYVKIHSGVQYVSYTGLWAFGEVSGGGGGINVTRKGDKLDTHIKLSFNTTGDGKHDDGKFYDIEVNPTQVSLIRNTIIKLKFINPAVKEI